MKKIISVIMGILMLISLSACKKEDKPVMGNRPIVDVSKESDIKIGVILSGNDSSDSAYIQAHLRGIEEMRKALGLSEDQIVHMNDVPVDSEEKIADAVGSLVESGCKIIFGTEREYGSVMAAYADDNPDVIFSNALSKQNNGKNLNGYSVSMYQGQLLCGIVAAIRTKTDNIGYVAYTKDKDAIVGVDAFALGVERIKPEAVVHVYTVESRCDYEQERQAAEALLDLGCDVIGQNTYTTAPLEAAQNRGCWGSGFVTDMTEAAPKGHLQAPVVNWSNYYTKAAKAAIEGTWKNENFMGGLIDGSVTLSPVNSNCVRGTTATVNESKEWILTGNDVFVGELVDNAGNIICEAGTMLTQSDIENGFDWYYRNIVVEF